MTQMVQTSSARDPVPLWKRLVFGRRLERTLLRAAVLALVVFLVSKFMLVPVRISGESMEPTYRNGRVNCINRLAYRWSRPQRGDVVAVRLSGPHVMLFKRVVGLPGETVAIERGFVVIDGKPLSEPYVKERAAWHLSPLRLEPDEYMVIGDNRGMPQQWHTFGAAKADRIMGKVFW
jgi:signal peptidase I